MKRIIYHGSDHIIRKPVFGAGKRNNDYGLGFYCTEYRELAMEWAVQQQIDGVANCYQIEESGLQILNLNTPAFTCLNWLELLLCHRTFNLATPVSKEAARYLHQNFHVDTDDADVIIGYRADDSYFTYAQDFLNNGISCGQLADALQLGDLGLQYVVKSNRAFERLEYRGYEAAPADVWYPRKYLRDRNARRRYYEMDVMTYIKNDLYMIQILDQEVQADDPRIR